ncbi:hypothetical protein CVT26_012082 [Gymnopilus dilepis]|uniref:Uncharacterized protein n=1 Tax=Gymnopilus dilepis TaxID=231916 RepID=A0A409W9G7_9AGAR|nr:hypothetical protein CVT26_012082 [Gymnopilus dilepis]
MPSKASLEFARQIQGHNAELVVYSRLVGTLVELAWPLRADGSRLPANELFNYLRQKNILLECNCGLQESNSTREPLSCVIRWDGLAGHPVLATCNESPSVCGMMLNITSIARTSRRTSQYLQLPDSVHNQLSDNNAAPPVLKYLHNFRRLNYQDTTVAPYFPGYFGEYSEFYGHRNRQIKGMYSMECYDYVRKQRAVPLKVLPRFSLTIFQSRTAY